MPLDSRVNQKPGTFQGYSYWIGQAAVLKPAGSLPLTRRAPATTYARGTLVIAPSPDQASPATSACSSTPRIDFLETHRGSDSAEYGDRTYGVFNLAIPNWVLCGFYGRCYQAPPSTVSGQLSDFALTQGFRFLLPHGDRNQENQFGIAIPWRAGLLAGRRLGRANLQPELLRSAQRPDPAGSRPDVAGRQPRDTPVTITSIDGTSQPFANAKLAASLKVGLQ
jgi:hypothetical protein